MNRDLKHIKCSGRPDHKTRHKPQQSPLKTHTTKYTSPHKQSHPRAQRHRRPENLHPQGQKPLRSPLAISKTLIAQPIW